MSHSRTWKSKAFALALVAVVSVAVMTALGAAVDTTKGTGVGEAASCAPSSDRRQEVTRTDQGDPTLNPAACRRLPECWINEDCDTICGVGLGKCVHSSCPVRVCRCH